MQGSFPLSLASSPVFPVGQVRHGGQGGAAGLQRGAASAPGARAGSCVGGWVDGLVGLWLGIWELLKPTLCELKKMGEFSSAKPPNSPNGFGQAATKQLGERDP